MKNVKTDVSNFEGCLKILRAMKMPKLATKIFLVIKAQF